MVFRITLALSILVLLAIIVSKAVTTRPSPLKATTSFELKQGAKGTEILELGEKELKKLGQLLKQHDTAALKNYSPIEIVARYTINVDYKKNTEINNTAKAEFKVEEPILYSDAFGNLNKLETSQLNEWLGPYFQQMMDSTTIEITFETNNFKVVPKDKIKLRFVDDYSDFIYLDAEGIGEKAVRVRSEVKVSGLEYPFLLKGNTRVDHSFVVDVFRKSTFLGFAQNTERAISVFSAIIALISSVMLFIRKSKAKSGQKESNEKSKEEE